MPKRERDDWRLTSIFVQPGGTAVATTPGQSKKQTLLVDLKTAAEILGIPLPAVRRLVAEDRLPAIRAGRGGKFWIARTAIEKFAERIR